MRKWFSRGFWISHWETVVFERNTTFLVSIEKTLLDCIAFIYEAVVQARNFGYDSGFFSGRKVSVPVISIGNISLGGTGKTALTIWCCEKLLEKNLKPAVLTRGYFRKSRETLVAQGSYRNVWKAGDEPCMMAQKLKTVPIGVGSDRRKSAEVVQSRFRPDCLVLDDGFQHRALARDLDVVCLTDKVTGAGIFPSGILRESVKSLRRASFVVIKVKDKSSCCDLLVQEIPSQVPYAVFSYRAEGLKENGSGTVVPVEWLRGKKVLGCCGLADGSGFEKLLRDWGAEVCSLKSFPDHHHYKEEELKELLEEALTQDARIVTTEKDLVRMPENFPAMALQVGLDWHRGEKELLEAIFGTVKKQ